MCVRGGVCVCGVECGCVGVECVCVGWRGVCEGWSVCVRGGPTSMGGSFRSRTRRDWRTRLENLGPIAT